MREDSEVRGEDSDDAGRDGEADPCPEAETDAENLDEVNADATEESVAAF